MGPSVLNGLAILLRVDTQRSHHVRDTSVSTLWAYSSGSLRWLLASLKRVHQLVAEVLGRARAVDGEQVVLLWVLSADLSVLRQVLGRSDVAIEQAVSETEAKAISRHVLWRKNSAPWAHRTRSCHRGVFASLGSFWL